MKPLVPSIAAAAAVAALTCLVGPQAHAAPATLYCKVVNAETLTFFDTPSAQTGDGYFVHGDHFYVDRTDAPYNRYHVVPSGSRPDGWVSSDPSWTSPSSAC